jgi:quercetin dioxygenase-like cupin family protein
MSMISNDEARSVCSDGVLVSGADTNGRFALIEVRLQQGVELPRHIHHWEDLVVYVLDGKVIFFLDGVPRPSSAGACVVIPAGCDHTCTIASHEARWLVMATPAGLERLYRELDGLGAEGHIPVEQLVAVAARYGIEITGPPPAIAVHTP